MDMVTEVIKLVSLLYKYRPLCHQEANKTIGAAIRRQVRHVSIDDNAVESGPVYRHLSLIWKAPYITCY